MHLFINNLSDNALIKRILFNYCYNSSLDSYIFR